MNAPDREEFIKAVVKEKNDHNWVIIDEDDVPEGAYILDVVWLMKQKRDILTRKVYK